MKRRHEWEFNVWPSFTDLMLSVVLILSLVLFASYALLTAGTINLEQVLRSQESIIASIGTKVRESNDNSEFDVSILLRSTRRVTISVRNEPQLQIIRFSGNVLFKRDSVDLSPDGAEVLEKVGLAINSNIDQIREIQIQGHADTDKSARFSSNLELASRRAITVYNFLVDNIGVNPAERLLSVTSFGEYKPTARTSEPYSMDELVRANDTDAKKTLNRRIELLLFYKF